MNFPSVIETRKLDSPSVDWVNYHKEWDDIELLAGPAGILKAKAEYFLTKRPKEPMEVYAARVQRFSDQRIMPSILTWYGQALFKLDPQVYFRTVAGGTIPDDSPIAKYYGDFQQDCDKAGTTLVDFYRKVLRLMLAYRRAYVLVDLDDTVPDAPSLGAQKAAGGLSPHLTLFSPQQAINCGTDQYGNLTWIVFKTLTADQQFTGDPKLIDRWYYFDQRECAVYESVREQDVAREEPIARLLPGYPKPHALSEKNRVPVRIHEVPEGLWLGDRLYLDAPLHLNTRNALYWGLFMGCLPVMWVKGGFLTAPTVTETGYVQLAEGSEVGYLEPSGHTYEITSKELEQLRQEMYRACWLVAQGKNSSAQAASESGVSKEQDMAPARDVLNGLGDIIRAQMQLTLGDVSDVRGDEVIPDVNGFEFDDIDEAKEISVIELARDLDIQSDTLDKEVQKRAAELLMRGRNRDEIDKVKAEIDAAPTKSEIAEQQAQQQKDSLTSAMQMGIQRYESKQVSGELNQ